MVSPVRCPTKIFKLGRYMKVNGELAVLDAVIGRRPCCFRLGCLPEQRVRSDESHLPLVGLKRSSRTQDLDWVDPCVLTTSESVCAVRVCSG